MAWFGFAAALAVSVWVASPRIALASGLAYICAQLVDIHVFDRLRDLRWWRAPLASGVLGAILLMRLAPLPSRRLSSTAARPLCSLERTPVMRANRV